MTERVVDSDGTSTHLAVKGEEGAVSFFWFKAIPGITLPADRDGLRAGDVVTHMPTSSGYGYDDCPYVPGGCDTHYWSGRQVLDILIDEGEEAVYTKLEDVYRRTFSKEAN